MKVFISACLGVLMLAACAHRLRAQDPADDSVQPGPGLIQPETLPGPGDHSIPQPIPLPPIDPAEVDHRLTFAEAESLAIAFHPAMRETAGRVRAAEGNWLQVGLQPNPEIGYSGQEIGDEGRAGMQGGYFSQEFVTAGKLGLNRAVASRDVAAAEQRMQLARLQVVTTTRTLYIEALAAERFVVLARNLRDIANQSTQASEQRLKAQDIPRVSLLQSQVERESTALLEEQAVQRHDAAWRRLATAVGLPEKEAQAATLEDVLVRPLPVLAWQPTRERLLSESPELAEQRFELERARLAVRRASVGRVPNVEVNAGAAYDYASNDTIANVQVSMPVPLFDRNQGAIAQAYGELSAAQAALEQRQLALEQRLANALRDYNTARERAARYAEKVLPVARESLDLMGAGYREGELDFTSVLTAQRTYAENNLAYLQDLETAWKKWAEIDGLLVGSLPDSN